MTTKCKPEEDGITEYDILGIEPPCNCKMDDDFGCPHCGGNMIDIEGHFVCRDCEFID